MGTHLPLASNSNTNTNTQNRINHQKRRRRRRRRREKVGLAANLDLVREILLRLPAKSIFRFKCVCKDWRDLTSDPYFVARHTRCNPKVSGVFMHNDGYSSSCSTIDGSRIFPEPWVFSDDNKSRVYYGMVLHSCNGLLLGKYWPGKLEGGGVGVVEYSAKVAVVYNPATLQHKILPNFPWYRSSHHRAVLAFDPWRSANYSVVLLCNYPEEIMLYRSETNSWQTLFSKDKYPWISSLDTYHYCFCNGLVYLFTTDRFLISIDVEKRSVNRTTTAICLPDKYNICYCGPSRGRLRLIRSNFPPSSLRFNPLDPTAVLEVLELQNDQSSTWLLLHRVRFMDLYSEICKLDLDWNVPVTDRKFIFGITSGIHYRSCLVEDDKNEDDKMVLTVEEKILAYDLGSRTIGVLCTADEHLYVKLVPCATTLVAP